MPPPPPIVPVYGQTRKNNLKHNKFNFKKFTLFWNSLFLVPDHLRDHYLPLRLIVADLPGSQVLEKQVNAWKGEKAIMKAM